MTVSKKNKEESGEEYRHRTMNPTDRARQARDLVARDLHQQNMRDGKNTTFEDAFKKATQVAEKAEREGNGR